MNKLYLMIGCPGSGKSTFAKKYIQNAKYISRDEIRFSLLTDDEEYFAQEDQVYREFAWKIYDALQNQKIDVIADATHLNAKARSKLFKSIPLNWNKVEVIAVFLHTPLDTCIARNELRKNLKRAYVPQQYIRQMFFRMTTPTFDEYKGVFNEIWDVYTNTEPPMIKKYNKGGIVIYDFVNE